MWKIAIMIMMAGIAAFSGGCSDDGDRPAAPRRGREDAYRQIARQNALVKQLDMERSRSAHLQAEVNTRQSVHGVMTNTLMILGITVAVCLFVIVAQRKGAPCEPTHTSRRW